MQFHPGPTDLFGFSVEIILETLALYISPYFLSYSGKVVF